MAAKSLTSGSRSASLLLGRVPEHHVLLGSVTVGAGGAANVTFSSIPQGFQHLQIRGILRGSGSDSGGDHALIRFNGDTTNGNYTEYHFVTGNGATALSSAAYGGSRSWLGVSFPNNTNAATGIFGGFICDILDYTSTTKNKTLRTLSGGDRNGSGTVSLLSSLWRPGTPAAITSLSIFMYLDTTIQQYSRFDLYGIA